MQRLRFLTLLFTCFTAMLCLSDTAKGQTLTLKDNNGGTTTAPGTNAVSLPLTAVSGTTTSVVWSAQTDVTRTVRATVNTINGVPPSWLRISDGVTITNTSPLFLTTGSSSTNNLSFSANATGLAQGTYNGSVAVQIDGLPGTLITVNVQLTVTGGAILSANPSSLTFSALQGAGTGSPTSTNVTMSTSLLTPFNFNVTPSTQVGNWLLVNSSSGNTVNNPTFSAFVNPSGLAAGTYNGTITVSYTNPNTLNQESVSIGVTLSVGGSSTISVSPTNPPPFLYQLGGSTPAPQTLTVSSTVANTSFSVQANNFFLVPSQLSGVASPGAPFAISVGVATNSLVQGTYNGQLTITPLGGNSVNVPYKVVVSTSPLIQVSTNTLTFNAPFAGQNPNDQSFSVTATGAGNAVGFTTTVDQAWLSATPNQNSVSSGSPAAVQVHVSQNNLSVGTYTGNITIRPTNGDDYQQVIAVTLSVGTSSQITVGPSAMLFSFQQNKALPSAQIALIQSTGQQTTFTVSAATSTCGSNWLIATTSANVTPAALTVTVNAGSLTPGACTGLITITPSTGTAVTLSVTTVVSAGTGALGTTTGPLLTISQPQGFGNETVQSGAGQVIQRFITFGSTDPAQQVGFNITSTQSWLSVNGGTSSVGITINPTGLPAGVYPGSLIVFSSTLPTANNSFTIPVLLNVTPNVSVALTPSSLEFTMTQGGSVPASRTVTFSSSGGTPTFTATVNSLCSGLLSVTPSSGVASGNLTVSVLANSASVGIYNCSIQLAYQNAATTSATIPVTLSITTPRIVNISPTSLAFTYQLTQSTPAAKPLSVTSTGGTVQFNVATASTPAGWLQVDTSSATTPRDVQVSVNVAGLTAGTYTGSVTISAPGVLQNPVTVPVTLTVTAPPLPAPLTIASSASGLAGAISPGSILTIKGSLLGPTTPVSFTVNSVGGVNSVLASTRVLFDGIPGTPTYVSATQINVVAPYEIAGRLVTNIVVEYQNIQSAPIQVRVTDVTPAIFTQTQDGSGPGAIVNQNGTINGPGGLTIPATVNTVVSVYGTGCGQTNPPSATGSIAPTTSLRRIPPVGTVTATIGIYNAIVEFAGSAPGYISGACQYNVRIPTPPVGQSISGAQSIILTINGVSSPQGPTISIQ